MAKIIQRYQSSFTLHAQDGRGAELALKIRANIHGWLVNSERNYYRTSGCFVPKQEFLDKCQVESTRRGLSKVETSTHYLDDHGSAWCMRYTHTDKHPGINWVTECGLRLKKDSDDIIFSVMLTVAVSAEYRLSSDVEAEWELTVPRFVREAVGHVLVKSVSINGITLPLKYSLPEDRQRERFIRPWMYWAKTADEAKQVAEIIADPRRRFAVALVMGETPLAKEEVRELSTKLCGKVYVCLVSAGWTVAQHFKNYEVEFNHVRVILPFYTHKQDRLSRHPTYALKEDQSHAAERIRILESQDEYVTSFENGAIYQLSDIAALNRLSDFHRKSVAFQQAIKDKTLSEKDGREMLEYATQVQNAYEEQKDRADRAEKDRDEWKALVGETEDECQRKLESQKANYEGQLRRRQEMFVIPERFPKKAAELRVWSSALTNLEIDEHAWDGMKDRDKEEKVELAWNMLWHLNTTMHRIVFEAAGQGELRSLFKTQSGYTYTADENEDVKKKWPEGHRAVVDGETVMCWRHIKRGNDDKQLVRIYFEFDRNRNKIVISWIGKHLRTNLTAEQ